MIFATHAQHNELDIALTLVGVWQDLAGYYVGNDSKYWCLGVARKWVCIGEKIQNCRGLTLKGLPLDTLPTLGPTDPKALAEPYDNS